jgi:competence ComEA-like helix-hairpin-helix protein
MPAMRALLPTLLLAAATFSGASRSEEQDMPGGPGKDVTITVCTACHGVGKIRRQRLSTDAWSDKIGDMIDRGAQATDAQADAIAAYLAANFGPDSKLRINTAPLEELKAVIGLSVPECEAVIAWRGKNGAFKNWQEVAAVPGVDAKKIETQRDRLAF